MPSFRAQPGISVFVPAVAKRSSEGAAWPGRTAPWACSSPR
jgi:hypothetical protein